MKFLYFLFVKLYPWLVRCASLRNEKASLWYKGRNNSWKELEALSLKSKTAPLRIWMHCASLGEFEQGRPLLERIRSAYPQSFLIVTFFSPSGYESKKNDELFDYVGYLPMDSPSHAKRFISLCRPDIIFFVKYEFWYYYLKEAFVRKIPTFLISGIFREGQPFFRPGFGFFRKMLWRFNFLFLQNEHSLEMLGRIGLRDHAIITGDTRFDRTVELLKIPFCDAVVNRFIQKGSPLLVAGSTWSEDDRLLGSYFKKHPEIFGIIVPHNIDSDNIRRCQSFYPDAVLYSESLQNRSIPGGCRILIIDCVGILSLLYRLSTISYLGGGFGKEGIHNVLEAAVYGKPVIFGPIYYQFIEAEALINCGGGFSIKNEVELASVMTLLLTDKGKLAGEKASDFVKQGAGACERIMEYLKKNAFLPPA